MLATSSKPSRVVAEPLVLIAPPVIYARRENGEEVRFRQEDLSYCRNRREFLDVKALYEALGAVLPPEVLDEPTPEPVPEPTPPEPYVCMPDSDLCEALGIAIDTARLPLPRLVGML